MVSIRTVIAVWAFIVWSYTSYPPGWAKMSDFQKGLVRSVVDAPRSVYDEAIEKLQLRPTSR